MRCRATGRRFAQQICREAGEIPTLPSQDVPNLARTLEFAIVRPGLIDLEAKGGSGLCPARRPLRITRDGAPVLISAVSAELLRNSPAG